jgi:hypothetical protein
LKTGVLRPDRGGRRANRFGSHALFVVPFPRLRLTQLAHAFGLGIHHPEVLVTLRFVLAPVVQGRFRLVFRALAPGLCRNFARDGYSAMLLP